jgi:hypothetical protein
MKSKFFPDWNELIQGAEQPVPAEVKAVAADSKEEPKETVAPKPETEKPDAEKKVSPPIAGKSVSTPSRKVSGSPTRKLSSANIERATKPAVVNGSDKKEVNGEKELQAAKPRPTTLSQSPAVAKRASAPPKTSTPAKPVDSGKASTTPAAVKSPMSPLSPISPIGTTPKSGAANASRKSSFTQNSSSSKAKQVMLRGRFCQLSLGVQLTHR